MTSTYRLSVDIGGTFTDGVLHDTLSGQVYLSKTLTTYGDPGEAVSIVVRDLVAQVQARPEAIREVVHATTLVTNAIIARLGSKTALLVTKGFADTLDIRREDRYDLFDLDLRYPEPLVPAQARLEVDERIGPAGDSITPLSDDEIFRVVEAVKSLDVEAVAICLLHAYANPAHEDRLATAVRAALGDMKVSTSASLVREMGEYERMSTVVANAYVQPTTFDYIQALEKRFAAEGLEPSLRIMVSSGGFTSPETATEHPVKLLESGPAAGVLSAINTAKSADCEQLLAFDMGGTTAKACVAIGGVPEITNIFEAGRIKRFAKGSGMPIMVPSIDLIEIGAGGGSIARVDDLGLLKVGPDSAGSEPGPACYGRGGENPTVTDADLMLGYLDPDYFLGGRMSLDLAATKSALSNLARKLDLTPEQAAYGIHDLVNENMAAAARVHIAEKGFDPRDFTMVGTGGAGPVHVVEVAQKLGIRRVLCPVAAGNGSCLGLLVAPARVDRSWSRVERLDTVDWRAAQEEMDRAYRAAVQELATSGVAATDVGWTLTLDMRFVAQGSSIPVAFDFGPLRDSVKSCAAARFAEAYRQIYGEVLSSAPVEITAWRLVGSAESAAQVFHSASAKPTNSGVNPTKMRNAFVADQNRFAQVPVFDRYTLPVGAELRAPLIVQEAESTLVIPRAASVQVLPDMTLSVNLD